MEGWGAGLDATKELLKKVLCEETHISKQTPALITGDNRGNTRCSSHFLSDLPLEPESEPTGNLGAVSVSTLAQTECIHQAMREGWKKKKKKRLPAGKTRLNDTFTVGCGPSKRRCDAE